MAYYNHVTILSVSAKIARVALSCIKIQKTNGMRYHKDDLLLLIFLVHAILDCIRAATPRKDFHLDLFQEKHPNYLS